MEFSLSGAGSPGSERRSGDGLDTRVKNKGTAGGGMWDKPLAREGGIHLQGLTHMFLQKQDKRGEKPTALLCLGEKSGSRAHAAWSVRSVMIPISSCSNLLWKTGADVVFSSGPKLAPQLTTEFTFAS